jgi:NAD(P)H-hydrate epimerase
VEPLPLPLPDWLTPLPDAETMRGVDRWAIEQRSVPGIELMERAGAGVVRAVERLAPGLGRVAVVCGKGNNGGDGLVVARLLREAGRAVTVLCTSPPEDYTGDAATNMERLPGEAPLRISSSSSSVCLPLEDVELIVDALLGTGFQGEPHGEVASAIEAIGASGLPVLSVDVPSGVDASSGVVAGTAVKAQMTVTFHAAKPGLHIRPGRTYAGQVECVDIGIPRGAPMEASVGLIGDDVLALIPPRDEESTKFSSGHVVLAGGSRGLGGAPTMSARAAMRAGAGYVTVCVPASLQPIVAASGAVELMTRAMPEADGALVEDAVVEALEACQRGGRLALALGPGLGRTAGASAFARELAARASLPLVLDADGLNAHAGDIVALRSRQAPTVLTPHAGELGRLLDLDSAAIEAERLRHAREAAKLSGAVVLLKGPDTLVAAPDGRVAVSPGASPALATAGTGDVLTGTIAALLAKGLDAFAAAAAGVRLCARAAQLAVERHGAAEGVIASDVIEALARAGVGDGVR